MQVFILVQREEFTGSDTIRAVATDAEKGKQLFHRAEGEGEFILFEAPADKLIDAAEWQRVEI